MIFFIRLQIYRNQLQHGKNGHQVNRDQVVEYLVQFAGSIQSIAMHLHRWHQMNGQMTSQNGQYVERQTHFRKDLDLKITLQSIWFVR